MSIDLDLSGVFSGAAAAAVADAPQVTQPQPQVQPQSKIAPQSPPSPATTRRSTKSTASRGTSGKPLLYFDLETVPDESRIDRYELPEVPSPRKLVNYTECAPVATAKDFKEAPLKEYLEKVAVPVQWLDEMLAAELAAEKPRKGVQKLLSDARDAITGESDAIKSAIEDRRKKMSCSPFHCRIVALSWSLGHEDDCHAFLEGVQPNGGTMSETLLLEHFWTLAARCGAVVGYNIARFDLPVIYVRSMLLGVAPTRQFDMKPWAGEVVDMYASLFPSGSGDIPGGKSMKNIDTVLGLDREPWELDEETNGSQVHELYLNDRPKLITYARSDVAKVKRLHLNFRGLFV